MRFQEHGPLLLACIIFVLSAVCLTKAEHRFMTYACHKPPPLASNGQVVPASLCVVVVVVVADVMHGSLVATCNQPTQVQH